MEDYSKLVKALRCELHGVPCNDENCEWLWHGGGCCDEVRLMVDAAAAIEALQAQLPKHGEWIMTTETSDDGAVSQHINCSVCGFYWREPKHRKVFKRCPNCGADMREEEAYGK